MNPRPFGRYLMPLLFWTGCASAWPGRPPPMAGELAKPAPGGDELLARLRGTGGATGIKYPQKYYLLEEPEWTPVRSPMGIVIGRRTSNIVVARLTRFDGSADKWPDLCVYTTVTLKEDATDNSGTSFQNLQIEGEAIKAEVSCTHYDQAQ